MHAEEALQWVEEGEGISCQDMFDLMNEAQGLWVAIGVGP